MKKNQQNLRIALVNPMATESEVLSPPLSLAYLAGFARLHKKNLFFKLFDFEATKTPINSQLEQIKKYNPQIIGLTATSLSINPALQFAKLIKVKHKKITVVLGGSHVTAISTEKYANIDSIIIGEGESAFLEIIKNVETGKKLPKKIRKNYLKNIDFIPAWDLISFKLYSGFNPARFNPQALVLWSRGCPFNCVFCSNCVWRTSIPKVRFRSPKNIVDELEILNKTYGIKEFFIGDDELNTNPKWLMSVCDEIINRKLKISWKGQARVNKQLTTFALFKKMKHAGCWHIAWGIENGQNHILRAINKKITTSEVERALKFAKRAGMKNMGLFMIGNIWTNEQGNLDGENFQDCQKSIDFAKKLRDKGLLDFVNFNIATPYPGSQMWNISKKFALISKDFTKKPELMDFHGVAFKHPYLSKNSLEKLHQISWITFTLNPRLIIKQLVNIRSFSEFKSFLKNGLIVIRVVITGHTRKRQI